MKNILIVVGSRRKGSFNKQLGKIIANKITENGGNAKILNYDNLPLLDQDFEYPAPEEVAKMREEFKWADKVWLISPEYNGSYSGTLKNLLDWASRPLSASEFGEPEFIKDKVVILSAAAGRAAGAFVIENLTTLTKRMAMKPYEKTFGLTISQESRDKGILEISPEKEKELLEIITSIL